MPDCHWYAARVRSRFELIGSAALEAKGFETLVPIMAIRRQWSDRIKTLQTPVFPGYVFCRFSRLSRAAVLECPGVVGVVAFAGQPAEIPDQEIEAVRTAVRSRLSLEPHAFLPAGLKVRIDFGPLAGVEGVVIDGRNDSRLVLSVTLLQRSVSVEVDRSWVRSSAPAPPAAWRGAGPYPAQRKIE